MAMQPSVRNKTTLEPEVMDEMLNKENDQMKDQGESEMADVRDKVEEVLSQAEGQKMSKEEVIDQLIQELEAMKSGKPLDKNVKDGQLMNTQKTALPTKDEAEGEEGA
jgi:lipoate-protein ligase A